MAHRFLGVESTDSPSRYRLPITPDVCVGPKGNVFMYGGVGLGAAIAAAERATARPAIWASAQFLSYARVGDMLDLDVEVLNAGRNVSQVRIVASRAGETVLAVNAALGAREGFPEDQWAVRPSEMPPPDECTAQQVWPVQDAALMGRLDVRLAPDRWGGGPRTGKRSEDGRMLMWMRAKDGTPIDAALLAIFADFVPSGMGAAFGRAGGGNSLDNTVRILRIVPTQWVLCDIRISGVTRGFGHGAIQMFADDGTLMATGSQSAIVRFMDPA